MSKEQNSFGLNLFSQLVTVVIVFLCVGSSSVFAQDGGSAAVKRYRVFRLRHISTDKARGFLDELKLGTSSALPSGDAILVTAPMADIVRVTSVINLIDSEQSYVVKPLISASNRDSLPDASEIASNMGNIEIGSFMSPPSGQDIAQAIIDVRGNSVIAIAVEGQSDKILAAIEELQKAKAESERLESEQFVNAGPAEPNQPAQIVEKPQDQNEPVQAGGEIVTKSGFEKVQKKAAEEKADELFDRLVGTLVEEQQKIQEQEEPNKPTKVGPAEPNQPAGELKEAIEMRSEVEKAEKVEEIEKAAIAAEKIVPAFPASKKIVPAPNQIVPEDKLERQEPVTAEPAYSEAAAPSRGYEPSYGPHAEANLDMVLPEKVKIIDLLVLLGEYMELDFMYDPVKVKGDVSLKLQGKLSGTIKVKELYALVESVLKFHNLVMTRKGNLVTVVPQKEVLEIDPALISDTEGRVRAGDVIVTRLFELEYTTPQKVEKILKGLKLGVGNEIQMSVEDTGALLVTDYAFRMARIEQLVRMVDQPGEPKEFRFRQLNYTMAENLAPKVKKLAEELDTVAIATAAPQPKGRPRGRPQRRPTAQQKQQKTEVYLEADERTNRILMIGYEDELDIVEQLITSLDVEKKDFRSLRIYDIQHIGAEEVQKKLGELGIISGGRITGRRPSAKAQPQKRGAESPAAAAVGGPLVEEPQIVIVESTNSLLVNATAEQHLRIVTIISYLDAETLEEEIPYKIYPLENQDPELMAGVLNELVQETIKDKEGKIEKVVKKQEDITIISDESTFSLIVYASKENQRWIASLIEKLDRRRPQVLIDVALVEITQSDQFEFDLNLIANAKDMVTNNVVFGTESGLVTGVSGTVLEGGWNMGGSGLDQGFYADDQIQALLTVMDKKNYGRVLAQPKVLVNDNEEGVITTSEKTYVKESTTSYTSEGVPITTSKWTGYPAKIELSITPNISEGDLLRLVINMTREDFDKKEDAPPDYSTSNVNTVVTVPDGSTIILGGLTKLNQSKGGSKVPFFGDIPLIGGLFRTIANSDVTSNLYIFVKANILRPSDTLGAGQLDEISLQKREAFERHERKFQSYRDWPGVDAEPMEPEKVLELE